MRMLNDLWVEISTEYRADFKNRMLINNFKKLNSISVVLLFVEIGLLFFIRKVLITRDKKKVCDPYQSHTKMTDESVDESARVIF